MDDQNTKSDHKFQVTYFLERWIKNLNQNLPLEEQLLEITHHKEIKNGVVEYISYLADDIPEKLIKDLNSILPCDIPKTDEHFTLGRELQLMGYSVMYSGIIDGIMSRHEGLHKYITSIQDTISFIHKASNENENLLKDVEFLHENLEYIIKKQDTCLGIVLHSMCYTMESLICAMIEKLLRIMCINGCDSIHKEKKNGKTKDKSELTLGKLLWNETIEKLFNYTHLKNLKFFLSKSNGIGLEYRNSLAHWNNVDKEKLNLLFVYFLLWLFTDVLNTVFLYFRKDFTDNFSHT